MRSVLWPVVLLIALQACATHKPDETTPSSSLPPATAGSASIPEPRKPSIAEVAKFYRAPIPVVVDAALRVYRDREVEVFHQETKDQGLLLSGRGRLFEYSMTLSPDPSGKTSVTVRCGGSALRENLDEAVKVLDLLSGVLLEPRE